jgi:putative endonuclease
MKYFVYALYSQRCDKIYIGQTSDISKRLSYHNFETVNSWTSRYRPWELIYSEPCDTRADAMKREKQLKTAKGRQFIWKMVEQSVMRGGVRRPADSSSDS